MAARIERQFQSLRRSIRKKKRHLEADGADPGADTSSSKRRKVQDLEVDTKAKVSVIL